MQRLLLTARLFTLFVDRVSSSIWMNVKSLARDHHVLSVRLLWMNPNLTLLWEWIENFKTSSTNSSLVFSRVSLSFFFLFQCCLKLMHTFHTFEMLWYRFIMKHDWACVWNLYLFLFALFVHCLRSLDFLTMLFSSLTLVLRVWLFYCRDSKSCHSKQRGWNHFLWSWRQD